MLPEQVHTDISGLSTSDSVMSSSEHKHTLHHFSFCRDCLSISLSGRFLLMLSSEFQWLKNSLTSFLISSIADDPNECCEF